jgi:hypothetical protein
MLYWLIGCFQFSIFSELGVTGYRYLSGDCLLRCRLTAVESSFDDVLRFLPFAKRVLFSAVVELRCPLSNFPAADWGPSPPPSQLSYVARTGTLSLTSSLLPGKGGTPLCRGARLSLEELERRRPEPVGEVD